MADDNTREASVVCVYWETAEQNPSLDDIGAPGRCTASNYFSKTFISCYNDGNCNGSGTCRDCGAYDVPGAQFSHKNATAIYGTSHLLQWNSALKKYIPVRTLNEDETSSEEDFINNLTYEQKTTTVNISTEQVPMNLAVYNLRAKFKKCCNWQSAPFSFYKNKQGVLFARVYNSDSVQDIVYTSHNANLVSSVCTVDGAAPWRTPFTAENNTAYGCNGCKPECPYYTGPKWQYCIDSKMDMGNTISASQVLELRYFSTNWWAHANPMLEYRKRFKDPEIYAWTGSFEFGGGEPENSDDNPLVSMVSLSGFSTPEPSIIVGQSEPADRGLRVYSDSVGESTQTYPTLIKELYELTASISITWPNSTSSSSPFIFRTFQIGQNSIRIYVDTPYVSTVSVVNITKHNQGSKSNEDFLEYVRKNYPSDLYTLEGTGVNQSLLFFDVELEFKPVLNIIKVFTRDPTNSDGDYLTDTCYVEHKFYHAVPAQTKGYDFAGHSRTEPWIDRFEHVKGEVSILPIVNSPQVDDILWDTEVGGKLSMYPIEEIHEETITNWVPIGCNLAAVTFDNLKCNNVMRWSSFGTSPRGENLFMRLDRSKNSASSTTGFVELRLILQSLSGGLLPGNVVIVAPAEGQEWDSAFDKKSDTIKARFYTTSYRQAPVISEDVLKLKYPQYLNMYMGQMPLQLSLEGNTFTAEGSSVGIVSYGEGDSEVHKRIYDLVDVKEKLYNRLLEEEIRSVDSFHQGGVADKDIKSSGEIFSEIEAGFNTEYERYSFESDGQRVTLEEVCRRLGELKFHEGDYTFVFIFKDETGRPIGSKRISMLFQAAKPEMRDVEIKYAWTMKLLAWPIVDSMFLLAKYNEPAAPADEYEGPETYYPRCGDHAEEFLRTHYFGDPGPMWYPYIACLTPRYHEDDFNIAVKCKNYVEGFGSGNAQTGSLEGKRWDYWERMRGPDMLSTHIAGTVFLVGCYYREISYSYQLTDQQKFTGYTRIRSGHPHAQFAKDREALRVSRHFIKRNLKVRNEMVVDANSPDKVSWTDEYKQYIFTDPQDTTQGILVGDEQETPIWVHLSDGVSTVNRTTSSRQHPFSHYLLQSVGNYVFSESFGTERYPLSEVIADRDLTSVEARNADGSLVYIPGDPVYMDESQNYDDIIPVYIKDNTAWAWLERPKDLVREDGNTIGGITVYNPTSNVWRTDRESATFTDEGPNELVYYPPVFDESSGALLTAPAFSWAGGPTRYFDWFTGRWVEYTGTLSIYSVLKEKDNFDFFGRGTDNFSFLADSAGLQEYVSGVTNSGTDFRYTVRGIGVDEYLQTDILPYDLKDMVVERLENYQQSKKINENFGSSGNFYYTADNKGYFYVEYVDIIWKYGSGTILDVNNNKIPVRYDVPSISIYTIGRDVSGSLVDVSFISSSEYDKATTSTVVDFYSEDGSVYNYNGEVEKRVRYYIYSWAGVVKIGFGALQGGGVAEVKSLEIWYRKPKSKVEGVMNYEQRVNISSGVTGSPDYREMLYYYSRTLVDYNDGKAYSQLEGDIFSSGQISPNLKSVKFTNRSVKDVILEYEYSDVTGTRFPYNSKVHPENSPLSSVDADGYRHIPSELNICTKSRTLIGRAHVKDNPQYILNGYSTVINRNNVASNENSVLCLTGVGNELLGENVQTCLYEEARSLLGGDVTTEYSWFWHPDEVDFWENIVGVSLPAADLTLTLTSVTPEMYRLYQHEHFGCTSDLSTVYSDGNLHSIPPWQALGHRLYVGNPKFNRACMDVVIFKIQDHIGERTYGTSEYGNNISSGGVNWPYETYRDRNYYLNAGLIEVGGYIGGSIGGVGPAFWATQSQLSHGFTSVQQDTNRETMENVYGGQNSSVRAEASRSHFGSDDPVPGVSE